MANLTTNLNYLQPTGFKVIIDRENYPNLEYFVQSFQHPDVSLTPSELPYRKVRSIPLAGGSLDFGELSMSIILDEDLKGSIDRSKTVVPSSADITLSILNSQNNKTKNIKYNGAIPTNLGGIQFESTSGGGEFLTASKTLRFQTCELL